MKFPKYLPWHEKMFRVVGTLDDIINKKLEPEEGKGYCENEEDSDSNAIYIYHHDPTGIDYPVVTGNSDGIITKSSTHREYTDDFVITKCIDMPSTDEIVSNMNMEQERIYAEELKAQMSKASSIYVPIFYNQDDFLKKTIKCALLEKGVDMNILKAKAPLPHIFSNLLNALEKETKMSVITFEHWASDLNLSYYVIVTDSDERISNPINGAIIYNSDRNELCKLDKEKFQKMQAEIDEVIKRYSSIEWIDRE